MSCIRVDGNTLFQTVDSPQLYEGAMPIKHVTDLHDVNLTQVVLHGKRNTLNRLKKVLLDNPQ